MGMAPYCTEPLGCFCGSIRQGASQANSKVPSSPLIASSRCKDQPSSKPNKRIADGRNNVTLADIFTIPPKLCTNGKRLAHEDRLAADTADLSKKLRGSRQAATREAEEITTAATLISAG